MRTARLWRRLLGVEQTVIEDVEFDEDEEVVVAHVRPRKGGRLLPDLVVVPTVVTLDAIASRVRIHGSAPLGSDLRRGTRRRSAV